jgi:hypothetical protein
MLRRRNALALAIGIALFLLSAGGSSGQAAPPAAPTNLHLCGGWEFCLLGYVTLIWNDNAGNEDRYEFEWSRALQGIPPEKNNWWNKVVLARNDTGHSLRTTTFVSGGLYFFRVRACNAAGCSVYSNRVSYTAP